MAHRPLGTLGVYWLVKESTKDAGELQMIVYREQEVGEGVLPPPDILLPEAILKLAKMSFLAFCAKFNL